jgi:hypothetical protein
MADSVKSFDLQHPTAFLLIYSQLLCPTARVCQRMGWKVPENSLKWPYNVSCLKATNSSSYTFPEMLCHLGAFLVRPLMSVSNLTRTVWK